MDAEDRRKRLLTTGQGLGELPVTGIDFIYVHPNQRTLDVHFLRDPGQLSPTLVDDLALESIRIFSPSEGTEIKVDSILWMKPDDKHILRIEAAGPGGFSLFKLSIDDLRIDRYFNHLSFSFKADCPSDLDCKVPGHECPPEEWVDAPIDYSARDFDSFRTALLDYASLRYPDWNDRLEADAGIMLMEVMSAMGDEMAYFQDRVSREAYLETASQRRSVRRHARMVDYPMHDGLGASGWIDMSVSGALPQMVNAGTRIWALSDTDEPISFEVGQNLEEIKAAKPYYVHPLRNQFAPHCWDEDDTCLAVGSTEVYVVGHHQALLAPGGPNDIQWMVLKTLPEPDFPSKVHLVRITEVEDFTDRVFGIEVTRIVWDPQFALPFEMDMTRLVVRGNILPISAGATTIERFIVGEDPDPVLLSDPNYGILSRAIERRGAGDVPIYLFSLGGSDDLPLVWHGENTGKALPEIILQEVEFDGTNWLPADAAPWQWRTSFIGSPSSFPNDPDYTLDDGLWRRVVGYQRPGIEIVHQDYDTGEGKTVRFGNGEFGRIPAEGTIFESTYRLGNGARGNVAAESIVHFDNSVLPFIESVENPFPLTNGQEAEGLEEVRKLAPEAFRAITYRAVRPEDYSEAAERLNWVQKAGTQFRWTGSWLTAFVTPDPKGSVLLPSRQREELEAQMDRFRQAGRQVYISSPEYADLDLEIDVCLSDHAFAGEVKARILVALFGKKGLRPQEGFFSPDRFTFGGHLNRSSLEAQIQMVEGVKAVESIRFRRRGWFGWQPFDRESYDPGRTAIIRISNDPLYPEQGTLKIKTHGGA